MRWKGVVGNGERRHQERPSEASFLDSSVAGNGMCNYGGTTSGLQILQLCVRVLLGSLQVDEAGIGSVPVPTDVQVRGRRLL